ncbi:GNAT family N-acetyltransferase [Clostridium estertheticum]|uniref:GNAT family N-acetyltransferase n=1 Tax=Clostridium estertheticum TaxID=238834 RepID=A0AA47I791_9CLOT|nr:GNAT family N-acetyltransferase [Clostridium estertheticum]MBU3155809.1 GNAT family N-acetyltransferase [Clostridium estertheticum]MBU3201430.1 GNAT family N-acetyltransferase [Clostridium estertheticum]WAG62377.1 GNAT family N-acetyltransferase [Clostridium estertheticum]WAG63516.1 GNAT family N-acetyltransferase [Clostridium estertheticum]
MNHIVLIDKLPDTTQYIELRKEVGWGALDIEVTRKGISNSCYCLCVECEGSLVGFGRVVGDGATVFYVHDIMVSPKFQKQKIGIRIMEKIMDYIRMNCLDEAFVGLIAKGDLYNFYKKFGFIYNENNHFYRL